MNQNPHIPELPNVAELSAAEAQEIFTARMDAIIAAGAGVSDRNAAYGCCRNLWPALHARLNADESPEAAREKLIQEKVNAGLTREQAIRVIDSHPGFAARMEDRTKAS